MTDIPPDIQTALRVIEALTAAGRCREDASLYRSATALVTAYLTNAMPAGEMMAAIPVPTVRRSA